MNVFQIHADDNVAVAVDAVAKGSSVTVGGQTFNVCQDIPAGHKIAIKEIKKGEDVVKYGFPIGTAKVDIPQDPGFIPTTSKVNWAISWIIPTNRKRLSARRRKVKKNTNSSDITDRRPGRYPQRSLDYPDRRLC